MGYREGTILDAYPAEALRLSLEAEMALHDNWDFIESWKPTPTSTETFYIYKNNGSIPAAPASQNSFGQSFHISLHVNTANPTVLNVRAFEGWDAVGKLCIRPCSPTTGGRRIGNDGSDNTLASYAPNISNICYAGLILQASPNSNSYQLQVSRDMIKIALKRADAAQYAVAVGIFQSFVTDPNEFPLCLIDGGASNFLTGGVAVSRHPKKASGNIDSYNFMHILTTSGARSGSLSEIDLYHGMATASKVIFVPYQPPHAMYGRLRGVLPEFLYVDPGTVSATHGDTITYGSKEYMKLGLSGLSAGLFTDKGAA